MVMGPTPPGTGVIAPATAAASPKLTSPTSRNLPSRSTRLMPTSITDAPGLTQSPRTISARPTAATRMSARRQPVLERIHSDFAGLGALVTDIDLRRRIFTYEHGGEATDDSMFLAKACRGLSRPSAQLGCCRLAIDNSKFHSAAPIACKDF